MGGTSPERDISLRTGKAVLTALVGRGYDVEAIDVGTDLPAQLRDKKIEIAFVALHGKLGEDGSVQGLLEVMRIPYTHSGVLASSVAMDKISSKRMYEHAKLPTPAWTVFHAPVEPLSAVDLPANVPVPFVVKPATAGSTIGISVVHNADRAEYAAALNTAARYDRAIVVEQFVAGTEITVAVLGGGPSPTRALPVIQIVPPGDGFFDFDAKYQYTRGKTQYLCPAPIEKRIADEASRISIAAHDVLGCEGVTRSDLIVDKAGKPWLLETNTIPGMTETS
ncbi:MAG TPA: D-alanine--D-alanine ligase, partial [bacterium]|nr:D-alanine--D-alanine ligase [bacterium]